MPVLIIYFLKLSISLAIVYLFYQLILRRLTFYNSNRWYLTGYTLLSFFIPLIDITPVLERNQIDENNLVQIIPVVEKYTISAEDTIVSPASFFFSEWDKWDALSFALLAGTAFFLLRFIVRCISFFRMRQKAELISGEGLKLYQVDKNIIPFSFGNSVFINSKLHTEEELQEIIRHEFVHVKQRHTLDIIWSEWLCIINWYNPFAWLLKASMRQNLEFIADNKVLQNGVSRTQYQYLLLKVMGNNHFSIAPKFNFSSLKKRIIMMNKIKTAKLHLVRFLFLLPLIALVLLAFRKETPPKKQSGPVFDKEAGQPIPNALVKDESADDLPVADTIPVPEINQPNKKGYSINLKNDHGNAIVVVKDRSGKEVERLSFDKWNDNQGYYENKYGKIPPPPPPLPPTPPVPADDADNSVKKAFLKRNPDVDNIGWLFNNQRENRVIEIHIFKKDGNVEKYDLKDENERIKAEKKYGKLPLPQPAAPSAPAAPIPPVAPVKAIGLFNTDGADKVASLCDEFEITDKKAIMHMKTGGTEEYDLTNIASRRKFEKKYGKIINITAEPAPALTSVSVVHHVKGGHTVIAPMSPLASTGVNVLPVDPNGNTITGEEDILATITRKTTSAELEEIKKQMKEKGIELKFDDVQYENDKLVSISGTMKSKDGHSNFSASDFSKLVLAMIRYEDNRTYFKVKVTDNKMVI